MDKKTETLVCSLIGVVATTAIAFVTFFAPPLAPVINSAISLASSTAITIVGMFAKDETKKLN